MTTVCIVHFKQILLTLEHAFIIKDLLNQNQTKKIMLLHGKLF